MIDSDFFFAEKTTTVGTKISLTLSNIRVSDKKLLSVIVTTAVLRKINYEMKAVLFAK